MNVKPGFQPLKTNQNYNTGSFANHLLHLLKKSDIKESLSYIAGLKREQYIKSLTRSETSIIFKLRTRMLNLKNNFTNNTNGDI